MLRPGGLALALTLVAGITATGPAAAGETKTVSYRGYQVTVPSDWPVVDLAANPTACVRLDQPAVYLGRSTAQSNCPAHLVGRSSGLVLEPLTTAQPSTDGLLRRAITDAGVLATAYYAPGDERAANDVLATGRVVTKTSSARVAQQAAVAPTVVATGNFAGQGFDTCDAPTQSTMDAWRPAYQGVGIYISGGLRACATQPNLTSSWVSANAAKGWQFLLIDVGLQAPTGCTTLKSRMSAVPATSFIQGKNAAINAVTAAQALGFAQRSAIYSDIESYTRSAGCDAAVVSYLSGWTQELNSRGYLGGAYVNATSGAAALVASYANTAYTRPDNIWVAQWNNTPGTISVPAANWSNHQRVHQYANATETNGGVKMNVDKNYLNLTAPPPPVTSFSVTGGPGVATLRWGKPANTTLGQIMVRNASGTTPPPLVTSGTAVYGGTASLFTQTGLSNSASYAYRVWVKDSKGKISPGVDARLVGTKATIGASAASIMYTGAVTLSTAVTRLDGAAKMAGVPAVLYSKAINASKWTTVGSFTTDANGVASTSQKPTVSTNYMWGYNGATGLLGTRSSAALVQVHPALSAYLTPGAIKLGASTLLYGYLNPAHAGTTAYLQRRSGTSWVAVTTGKLTTNGKYAFSIKPTARGTYTYRVVWLADADHQGTQTASKVLTVS
ncbi:glycoside hydrolase domain-containing protein [Kribbella sp. NPDC054772]